METNGLIKSRLGDRIQSHIWLTKGTFFQLAFLICCEHLNNIHRERMSV